ncbi:MAG: ABC transporter substrate-binding protein [Clostridia bacterium]|nr:ABC transporter substrate-binding protein [Clostridia bacterium]
MLKRTIALMLVLLMVVLTGCGKTDNTETPQKPQNVTETKESYELQLLYCANDTLNPYKTISKLNAELGLLLFDSLFKYDNEFETIYVLATSLETVDNVCTITLRNAKFTDGSTVTADDVVYSYNLALQSERFKGSLYEISSVVAVDTSHIAFTLNCTDPYFEKLLTFPIIKAGSDTLKNEDNVELPPIGSGRYVFDEKNAKLLKNEGHYSADNNITEISLINAPDSESMEHYVEIGATDIYFAEMTDDTIIRMSSKKVSVNQTNLVYIGINHNYSPLKSDAVRFAISAALSRKDIATKAFYANATAATGFFHPSFKVVSDYQSINPLTDEKISIENLANIGYNELNTDRYYENDNGKILEFTLLVNKDSPSKVSAANLIAEQLANVGIKITVNALGINEYFSALQNGHFQLYLGEVKLLPNMDMRSLVINGGSAAYGMVSPPIYYNEDGSISTQYFDNETSYVSVVNGFYSGKNTIIDVASALQSSMPIIPLVYKNSLVFYSKDIEDVYSPSYSDIFISIDKYIVKK